MAIPNNKFAYYRKKCRLTQFDVLAEIQKATGKKYRQGTISSWENGKTVPDMYILQVLASIFNVKIDDLYETPAKMAHEPDAGPSLATFEYQINSAQKIFDDGDIVDAYNRLKMVTGEILAQLTKTTAEHERLKGKLKTAQDVLKL